MRKFTSLVGVFVLHYLPLPATAVAADICAEVVDNSGNTVTLSSVTTDSLTFDVDRAEMNIRVDQLRRIHATGFGRLFDVSLISGTTMRGSPKGSISGDWDLGSYKLDLSRAETIDFHHAESRASDKSEWRQPLGFVAELNGTKVYGLRYLLPDIVHDSKWTKSRLYPSENAYLWLPIMKGHASYFIPFSRLRRVTTQRVELTDGITLDGGFRQRDSRFTGFRGQLKGELPFGDIKLSLAEVQTIHFLHDEDVQVASRELEQEDAHQRIRVGGKPTAIIAARNGETIEVNRFHIVGSNNTGLSSHEPIGLQCYIGGAFNTVDLSQLREIRDVRVLKRMVNAYSWTTKVMLTLVTKSEKTVLVGLEDPDLQFGGLCDFGYVRIRARDAKGIRFD